MPVSYRRMLSSCSRLQRLPPSAAKAAWPKSESATKSNTRIVRRGVEWRSKLVMVVFVYVPPRAATVAAGVSLLGCLLAAGSFICTSRSRHDVGCTMYRVASLGPATTYRGMLSAKSDGLSRQWAIWKCSPWGVRAIRSHGEREPDHRILSIHAAHKRVAVCRRRASRQQWFRRRAPSSERADKPSLC